MEMASERSANQSPQCVDQEGVSSLPPGGKIARYGRAVLACVWPIRSGYDVVRVVVAVILLVAAGLKCHQLSTEPILEKTWLDARWLLMATVEFELFFGLWLLSNNLPKLTWLVAIGCFGVFTCVSLYKALSGYASCGCFGTVHVNPWYTSTMDLGIVASLLIWRPSRQRSLFTFNFRYLFVRMAGVLVIWFNVGLPAAYAMCSYINTAFSDIGTIVGNGKFIVLKPEKWIGKRFPLLPHISDCPAELDHGQWSVILYTNDCPRCREYIQQFQKQESLLVGISSVAFIETSNISIHDSRRLVESCSCCVTGHLDDSYHYLVETPLIVTLLDGIASRITHPNSLFEQNRSIPW